MPKQGTNSHQELKAVILAAGKESDTTDAKSILLQNLGSRKVIDYVIQNALQLVSPEDLYIVVSHDSDEMRAHLGSIINTSPRKNNSATGHAVLQLKPLLADFHGDLFIIYGDTPLFRLDSIRGLLNRHPPATGQADSPERLGGRPYPYGRIIRDAKGQIVDIIEAAEASESVRAIHELNIGAYVVRADTISRRWKSCRSHRIMPASG